MRRFPQLAAFFRRLDAVADGIANEMRQRFRNRVENALVQICFLAA